MRIPARALCLRDRQRQPVLPVEHIIAEPFLQRIPLHTRHTDLLAHIGGLTRKHPARFRQIHIDVDLARLPFRQILRGKTALRPMLLLIRRDLGRHLPDRIPKRLNLRFLFPQQTLLLPDLFRIEHDRYTGNFFLGKRPLLIRLAVAIINPLDKFKQIPQRDQRRTLRYRALRMHRQISQLHNERQLPPRLPIHRETETRLVQHRLQMILIRPLHILIRIVHPLHRQLQSLPAAHGAHRGR